MNGAPISTPGQPAHLVVGREDVALHADVGDDSGGLGGRGLPRLVVLPIGSVCLQADQTDHAISAATISFHWMLTFDVTFASR